MRPPGSQTRGLPTCQGLRPRGTGGALAIAHPAILPSASQTASASRTTELSRLNTWPISPTVNASRSPSRDGTHDSWPMRFALPFIVRDFHPLLLPVSRRTRGSPWPSIVLRVNILLPFGGSGRSPDCPAHRPRRYRRGHRCHKNQRALASSRSNLKSTKTRFRKPRRHRNSSSRTGLRATPKCWGSPSTFSHPTAEKTWMPGLRPP
jgi:hypothetical protein